MGRGRGRLVKGMDPLPDQPGTVPSRVAERLSQLRSVTGLGLAAPPKSHPESLPPWPECFSQLRNKFGGARRGSPPNSFLPSFHMERNMQG